MKQILTGFGIVLLFFLLSRYLLKDKKTPRVERIVSGNTQIIEGGNTGMYALSSIPIVLPIPDYLTFCGEHVPLEDPDVLERFEKELYITAHRYYQVVFYLKRGPRIFPEIEKYLQEVNAPEDLIYLAAVESDLIPNIRSPKGAQGIWQFMPETARRYGLKVNKYVDERMHLEKSTKAAVKYLKDAKDRFGSWTVAAAAYNMGVVRTQRTINSQKVDDYYKMYLNSETARYVFRILAVKAILESPAKYGFHFPESEAYRNQKSKTVVVNKGINNVPDWAIGQGTTYYDVKRLNPWIINIRLPQGRYEITLPL